MLFCVWFGCEDYGLDGCVNGGEYGGEDSSEVVGVDGGWWWLCGSWCLYR